MSSDPLRALARAFAQADNECDSCEESLMQFAEQAEALQREADAQIAEHYQIPGHSVAGPQIAAIAAAIRGGKP